MQIKCRLNVILAEREIGVNELSVLTGINAATLSEIKNNKRLASLKNAIRISKALGMKIEDIWIEVSE